MKYILFLIFVICFFYNCCFAQENKLEFGAHFGLNSSSVITSGNSSFHSSQIIGDNFGISANYFFSNSWSIKTNVNYEEKGWQDGFFNSAYDNVKFRLNYITVPILVDWHFTKSHSWYLGFGPYIGVLTNSTSHVAYLDINGSISKLDDGLAFAFGKKIHISNSIGLFVELSGQGGINHVFKDYPGDGTIVRNISESADVGIEF